MSGEINLISIEILLELSDNKQEIKKPKYTFFIPGYQRGYRWTNTEVIQLLNDIRDFTINKSKTDVSLYCLQPIVVKKIKPTDSRLENISIEGSDIYEIIDGQQRLTTIYLILKWLNERYKEEYQKQLFQIVFETRTDSEEYLKTINEKDKDKNIDYYHIFNAYKSIKNWFLKITENQKHIGEIETVILKNAKPIWYQIPENTKSVEVFRALNVGKIRLTNFELIKALFLSKTSQNNNELLKIANDWEVITKALMNDSFWDFISNSKIDKFQRIEYLFEIQSLSFEFSSSISKDEKLKTFLLFQDELKKSNRIELWKKFKQLFLILQSWYEDRELYHLIGYLIYEKRNEKKEAVKLLIKDLREENLKNIDTIFKELLYKRIKETIKIPIEQTKYKNQKEVRNTLLLFNIATLLEDNKSNIFFNFSEFKDKNWDIEHIKSVTSDKPSKREGQLKWMKGVLWYFMGLSYDNITKQIITDRLSDNEKDICLKLYDLCNAEPINDVEFSDIYDKILNKYNEQANDSVDNTLANLTLLDENTNRSYGNAIFPVKRKTIIELETKGGFVPVCTKNVFLKLYNEKASNNFIWNNEDGEKYKNMIVSKVSKLLNI